MSSSKWSFRRLATQPNAMSRNIAFDAPRTFCPPRHGERIQNGERIYYIDHEIGQGAFGKVYECWDDWVTPLVAKVLVPGGRTYENVRQSWTEECGKLITLRHPRITYIHDAFECRDTFYMVVERCDFGLDAVIGQVAAQSQEHRLRAGEAWVPYVARDVLQGLDFMHQAGYVHKDIHCGNVFVKLESASMTPQGAPVWSFKLGDLGISKLVEEINPYNTVFAPWMMTPEYLQPQMFGTVGITTDIYHVAHLLLQVLVGQTFQFTHEELVDGAPERFAMSLGSRFSPALARALQRHTSARTPTAMSFWRDIVAAMTPGTDTM